MLFDHVEVSDCLDHIKLIFRRGVEGKKEKEDE